jgi:aminocarboxymuconate-semialdehyde decarboxylase
MRQNGKPPTIDIHCHRECAPATAMMRPEAERMGRKPLSFGSPLTLEVNRRQLEEIRPKMDSLAQRLADMDRMGVDIQAMAISPYQMYYWADPEMGKKVSRIVNDDLAEAVAAHPDRFVGLGTVPLQDTAAAVAELERCVDELGFRGLEIATNVEGEELSSPRLEPFWAAVEQQNVVVFIHPIGFTQPERLTEHYFFNVMGHPIENTLAIANLIFGGVMERHPGLKIVMAHGGGFLPAYAGRMDHAYHAREDVRQGLPKPPGEYLRQFHFDTVVFETDQLRFLIEKYGVDRLLVGTDYPYDMGEVDPIGFVAKTPGLADQDRAAIAGGNAARLLGIDWP